MPNFLLHLLRLLSRQRRCPSDRLACARGGLCDFVLGQALTLLPSAFECARCFGLEGGGGVWVGAGRHCGWLIERGSDEVQELLKSLLTDLVKVRYECTGCGLGNFDWWTRIPVEEF